MREPRLFVYGTLRPGHGHPMGARLAAAARHLGPATMTGVMYDLGDHPGVVPDPTGRDRVAGDLYLLHDADAILPILEDYEGEHFVRVEAEVRTSGRSQPAWVFRYTGPTAQYPRIRCGDYLGHIARESGV